MRQHVRSGQFGRVSAFSQFIRRSDARPKTCRPEFREWPIDFGNGGSIALYRYDGEDVVILAVRHRRRRGTEVDRRQEAAMDIGFRRLIELGRHEGLDRRNRIGQAALRRHRRAQTRRRGVRVAGLLGKFDAARERRRPEASSYAPRLRPRPPVSAARPKRTGPRRTERRRKARRPCLAGWLVPRAAMMDDQRGPGKQPIMRRVAENEEILGKISRICRSTRVEQGPSAGHGGNHLPKQTSRTHAGHAAEADIERGVACRQIVCQRRRRRPVRGRQRPLAADLGICSSSRLGTRWHVAP